MLKVVIRKIYIFRLYNGKSLAINMGIHMMKIIFLTTNLALPQ